MRSVWGTFPQYHTSADNLDFVQPQQLAESLRICASIAEALENNAHYRSLNPCCQPQLRRRNLYLSHGGQPADVERKSRLWVLNLSDGEHSLLYIPHRTLIPFS